MKNSNKKDDFAMNFRLKNERESLRGGVSVGWVGKADLGFVRCLQIQGLKDVSKNGGMQSTYLIPG